MKKWISLFTLLFLASSCQSAALSTQRSSQDSSQVKESRDIEFNDAHVHLTNYIQEGPDIRTFLKVMGNRVGRAVLFGIPLQQTWSYGISGDFAPKYYLATDAALYYYSFTDAVIAMAYQSLTTTEKARFDPMITGFNPADMYAADHIRRVLQTYPGVFSGIGEFTIHKEFVSAKVAGEKTSLLNPAVDRILNFAGEVGLVAIVHNDMDVPFSKHDGERPLYYEQMKALLKRHPKTTIIWAHTGLGRVVRPFGGHVQLLENILKDSAFKNVYFDISWDEVAKYIVATPESLRISSDLFNRFPDRFLFGTDEVGPSDPQIYYKVFSQYRPLWELLNHEASQKIRVTNYERIFNEARRKVREWEKSHPQ
jgi:predicted TIM-barrel fold metal-dependent hydrolase